MGDSDQDKANAALGTVIARAWRDPAFKAELLADPHKVLTAAGIELKPGMTIKVVENTDTLHHLVLPPKPTGELNDAELDKVAGGGGRFLGVVYPPLMMTKPVLVEIATIPLGGDPIA